METKFTPGPWVTETLYYGDIPENARVVIHAPPRSEYHSGTKVAEASFSPETSAYHVSDRLEAEANARLIAESPMLLFALSECVEHMVYSTPQGKAAYEFARAIILKATGGAE